MACVFPNFIDGHYVGMIKPSGGFGLHTKSLHGFSACESPCGNQFQCNCSVQANLPRTENHPHATSGDFIEQFIVAERMELNAECRRSFCQQQRQIRPGNLKRLLLLQAEAKEALTANALLGSGRNWHAAVLTFWFLRHSCRDVQKESRPNLTGYF